MNPYSVKEQFCFHFKDNLYRYIIIFASCILAVAVGIYLAVCGFSYSSLLTSADKNLFGYISGTAEYGSIFWSRFLSLLLCLVLIFCFNIVRETAFLNYAYLAYQMCLVVLSSSAIISLYGLSGILNVIFFVAPINIINFLILSFVSVVSMERASYAKKFRVGFFASFKECSYWKKFLLCFVIIFILCAIYSFVLPLLLKSFVIVNY